MGIAQRVALPGVGENLIDHCGTGVQAFPKADVVHDPDIVTEVGVRYTAPGSDQFNDMQLAISTIWDEEQVRGLTEAPRQHPSFGIGAVIQRPLSRGSVTLRSTDPNDQPQLDMNYASHPEDLRRLMDGARLCWEIMHSDEIAQFTERVIAPRAEVMESDNALADYVRRHHLNHLAHLRDGTDGSVHRPTRRHRSTGSSPPGGESSRRRRLNHARHRELQHESDRHHDRRTGGGVAAWGLSSHPGTSGALVCWVDGAWRVFASALSWRAACRSGWSGLCRG